MIAVPRSVMKLTQQMLIGPSADNYVNSVVDPAVDKDIRSHSQTVKTIENATSDLSEKS